MTSRSEKRWLVGWRGGLRWAMYFTPWSRKNRLTWWVQAGGQDVRLLPPHYRRIEVAKRVAMDQTALSTAGMGPAFGDLGKIAPQLCSWLCDSQYEDGSAKGRVQLQVERKSGRARVLLKVQDGGVCVEAYHESLSDALLTLELLLASDECPWQLDPFPFAGPKKGRKN